MVAMVVLLSKGIDFDALIAKLERQLIEVNKLKTEQEVRAKMSGK